MCIRDSNIILLVAIGDVHAVLIVAGGAAGLGILGLVGGLDGGNGDNAVSYTHLDVYKRQLLSFLSKVEGKRLVHNAVELFLADAGGKVFLVNRRFDFERRSRGFLGLPIKLAGEDLFRPFRGQLAGVFPQQDLSLIHI